MAVTINGDGTISGVSVGGLPDGVVDSGTLATGIDAAKLADGTITNSELQYINSLSSNAQTQINGAGATDSKFCLMMAAIETNITGDNTAFPIKDSNMSTTSWTEVYDTGNNVSDGVYTAPETGKYILSGICHINSQSSSHDLSYVKIRTSNRTYSVEGDWYDLQNAYLWMTVPLTIVADMDAGDIAWMEVTIGRVGKTVEIGSTSPGKTWFTGALLA